MDDDLRFDFDDLELQVRPAVSQPPPAFARRRSVETPASGPPRDTPRVWQQAHGGRLRGAAQPLQSTTPRPPPADAASCPPPSPSLQDKGKRPAYYADSSEDEGEYEEEELFEEEEEQAAGAAVVTPTAGAAAGEAEAATPAGLAAEDSEPGELTCAICLCNIPLENLAMVKVGVCREAAG